MPGKIYHELRVSRDLTIEVEAFLNLQLTAGCLMGELAELIKPYSISTTQYNVLRILRGAGEAGLPCGEVSDRLVTRDSDITRLFDRLEKRGLVTRERSSEDRRVVKARITESALEMLASVDGPVLELHQKQFGMLAGEPLNQLIGLLEELRTQQAQDTAA